MIPCSSTLHPKRQSYFVWLLVLLLAGGFFPATYARAQSTPDLGAELMERYQTVGTAFWEAEDLRNAQTPTPAQRKVLLISPIPESHLAYPKYFQATADADSLHTAVIPITNNWDIP